jgi:hypothetical protein
METSWFPGRFLPSLFHPTLLQAGLGGGGVPAPTARPSPLQSARPRSCATPTCTLPSTTRIRIFNHETYQPAGSCSPTCPHPNWTPSYLHKAPELFVITHTGNLTFRLSTFRRHHDRRRLLTSTSRGGAARNLKDSRRAQDIDFTRAHRGMEQTAPRFTSCSRHRLHTSTSRGGAANNLQDPQPVL